MGTGLTLSAASAAPGDKVDICHWTPGGGKDAGKYEFIQVSKNAAQTHLDHAPDYFELDETACLALNEPDPLPDAPTDPPTQLDECGTAEDTYTIPEAPGVEYRVDGAAKAAGTYSGSGTVTVTAVAQQGYVLTGDDGWTLEFTDVPCGVQPTPVSADAPTQLDECGSYDDGYTIPAVPGVEYRVGGVVESAGTYAASSESVTVTAVALDGYVLTGTTSWTLEFTDVPCGVQPTPVIADTPTSADPCGTAEDTYTIPSVRGVEYRVDGAAKAAGTYSGSGTVTVTAVALDGYVLTGTTSWTLEFTDEPCSTTPTEPTGENEQPQDEENVPPPVPVTPPAPDDPDDSQNKPDDSQNKPDDSPQETDDKPKAPAAAVPTAVDAGLGGAVALPGDDGSRQSPAPGLGLMGTGVVLLAAAGVLAVRRRGEHTI